MKYKDYPSKKELCTYIISELDKTILKISNAEENLRTITKHFEKLIK